MARVLREDMLWGVNGHNCGYAAYKAENIDKILQLAADMGSTVFRFNFNPVSEKDLPYIRDVVNKCHALGMQFMLVMDRFSGTPAEIEARMAFTARNLGNEIEFFQIFNETDIWCSRTDDGKGFYDLTDWTGMSRSYYNPNRVREAVEKATAALKGFDSVPHTGRTVINFGARHSGMMEFYVEAGLKWDIMAVDNYEQWDFAGFFKMMADKFPGFDFMIVECNYPFLNGMATEEQEADWLENFCLAINAIESPHILGVIIYELLDQPTLEGEKYYGEAHFGIVHTDEHNDPAEPKVAYRRMQKLLGVTE